MKKGKYGRSRGGLFLRLSHHGKKIGQFCRKRKESKRNRRASITTTCMEELGNFLKLRTQMRVGK